MKNWSKIFCHFLISLLFFWGCKKESTEKVIQKPPPAEISVQIPKLEKIEYYTYKSASIRDPFRELVGVGMQISQESEKKELPLNPDELKIKAIIYDDKFPLATLLTPHGTYIVKNKQIMDPKGKIVPQVAAIIEKNKVILLFKEKSIELKLLETKEKTIE